MRLGSTGEGRSHTFDAIEYPCHRNEVSQHKRQAAQRTPRCGLSIGAAYEATEADLSAAIEASPTLKSEGHFRARQWLGQSAAFAVSYGG
jgi:hypothetical protein